MQGNKPGKRCMVRYGFSFKEIHKIDIPVACGFDVPAGIDPVHAGVDHDLKQLSWRRLIFLYLSVGLIKTSGTDADRQGADGSNGTHSPPRPTSTSRAARPPTKKGPTHVTGTQTPLSTFWSGGSKRAAPSISLL